MCVNGLATIDLSALSTMQQVIMFWQMLIGSLVRPFFPNRNLNQLTEIGVCVDCNDCSPTVLFPTQVQARNPGAAKAVSSPADII
jgi:hypothetical protein